MNDIAKRSSSDPNFFSSLEYSIQITLLKTKVLDLKCRGIFATLPNRVSFCKKVSSVAVSVDQVDHFEFFLEIFRDLSAIFVIGSGEIKSFKEFLPTDINTFRVLLIHLVKVVDRVYIRVANV